MTKITIERETLLPCPFCGDGGDKGRQEVTQMIEGRNKFARITCRACGAMCPEENWNRRVAQPVAGPLNYGSILDALDRLPNDIKDEFENLARLVRAYGCQIGHCEHDKHLLAAEPSDAEAVCAQAYQVVGSLLDDLGQFETERARKILDNLEAAKVIHDDVLPWPSFAVPAAVPLTDEQIEKIAVENEAFGFGRVDEKGITTHGFEPEGLRDFVRAVAEAAVKAEQERCAKVCLDMQEGWPSDDHLACAAAIRKGE